jgi:hypothetical protein
MPRSIASTLLLGAVMLGACGSSKSTNDAAAPTAGTGGGTGGGAGTGTGGTGGGATLSSAFAATARTIADEYIAWGRVDDEWRWAPGLCRIPYPGVARESTSTDPTTHGQKLYSVFAKKRTAYPNGPHTDQVVVKQSWRTELVTGPDAGAYAPQNWRPDGATMETDDHFYPYAKGQDGGVFRATEPAGHYIMWRVDPATPDTDEGWVYATILPSGEVTSAGRVSSCMGCHEVATHERLFGVPTGALGL